MRQHSSPNAATQHSPAMADAATKYGLHRSGASPATVLRQKRCAIHHRNAFDASARRIMHRTQTLGTVVSRLDLEFTFMHAELRLGTDDVDHACRGIAAEQGSLWPTQYFDALNVEVLLFE